MCAVVSLNSECMQFAISRKPAHFLAELASARQHHSTMSIPTIMERAVVGKAGRGECGLLRQAGGGEGEGGRGAGRRRLGFLALRQGGRPCGPGVVSRWWLRRGQWAWVILCMAAERLALLRCRPQLLAVPVRLQQVALASFERHAGPLRPTQG